MKQLILIIVFLRKKINCGSKPCFEYSCDECNSEEYGSCTKCRDGFQLIDGKCPCGDSSCALCENGFAGYGLCFLCKKGYFIFLNDCYCLKNNCEQCAENGCYKCKAGYFFNDTTKECEKESEEDKFKCYDENCESCSSNEKGGCDYCIDGYVEKKGECIQLPIPDENNTCPEGYYFYKNKCEEKCGGVNCTIANSYYSETYYTCSSNKCLVCVNNELRIFSGCNNTEECSLMGGCLNCITSDVCLICNQGYYLLGGKCIKCIEGCSICSNNNTCEYCMSGYSIDSDKLCNLTNIFDYNLDIYNNRKNVLINVYFPEEIPIITIPIKSDSVKLTEELIETTPETQAQEQNNMNLFIDCDKYCLKCLQNTGECLECEDSYTLKNNKCIIQCSENCLSCSFKNGYEICNTCKLGYDVKNGKCSRECIDDNCNDCPNDIRVCTECKSGQKLFDGICGEQSVTCPKTFPNCLYCYKQEKCLECLEGFELDKVTGLTCKKKTSYISIIFTILGIGIIFVGIISFCVYQKKKSDNMKFYICKHCGNVVTIVDEEIPTCCGEDMKELRANTTDGAVEKHVPVYDINESEINVTVGSVEHPMLDNHYINFIALVDSDKIIKVDLKPGDKPVATFPYIKGSKIYEYCNLHGLWVKDVK